MRFEASYIRLLGVLFLPLLLSSASAIGRSKTDIIFLDNGDRITGEIKKLERGLLNVSTDSMGTVSIEWKNVEKIESQFLFEVELSSGTKYFGSIVPAKENQKLEVIDLLGTYELDHMSIVHIVPIEKTFLDRLNFSLELGASFYRANRVKQIKIGTSGQYRTPKYSGGYKFRSTLDDRKDVDPTRRNELNLHFIRYLKNRWFFTGLSNFLQSEELDLDLRATYGGGLGRNVLQTNNIVVSVYGGAMVNSERFSANPEEDQPAIDQTSLEALGGIRVQTFKFENPEMDLVTSIQGVPSLSDFGRFRIEFSSSLRIELFKDFFWSLNLFDDFDSRPPEGTETERNDFGIDTTFGWSF